MPRQPQPFLTQLFDLTLIQLSNWRWSWRNTIVIGMIVPLISMVALSSFAGKDDDEADAGTASPKRKIVGWGLILDRTGGAGNAGNYP